VEIGGSAVTIGGLFGQTAFDDPAQLERRALGEREHRRKVVVHDGVERLGGRVAPKRPPPCRHLVENQAERKLIGMEAGRQATRLFRTHVRNRARHKARLRLGLPFRSARRSALRNRREAGGPRQSEVEHLRAPGARDHDVLGLEIAMRDACVVGGRQPVGDLRGEIEQPFERNRPAGDLVAKRLSLDELRDDVRGVAVDGGVENSDDVRVIECACGPRFGDESPHALGIGLEPLVQNFQRDVTFESRIPRAIDLAAAALAEGPLDFVRSERRPWTGPAWHGALPARILPLIVFRRSRCRFRPARS
jgi:hypothetical protein